MANIAAVMLGQAPPSGKRQKICAGDMSLDDFTAAEQSMARSAGSCMTMGTASTMANMMEAMGLALAGNAALPAVDARRRSFEYAIRVNATIGGSTNAVLHLIAIAGRLEIPLESDDWDSFDKDVATILNLQLSGKYLMEDFCYAGGLPVIMKHLLDNGLLHGDAATVSGCTVSQQVSGAKNFNTDVIKTTGNPLTASGGIAVLRGNLALLGAVIKPLVAYGACRRL